MSDPLTREQLEIIRAQHYARPPQAYGPTDEIGFSYQPADLASALIEREDRIEEFKQERGDWQALVGEKDAKIASLTAELIAANAENELANAEIEALAARPCECHTNVIAQLEAQLSAERQEVAALEAERDSLTGTNELIQQLLDEAATKHHVELGRIAALTAELENLKTDADLDVGELGAALIAETNPEWHDEFVEWYKPSDWLGSHRAAGRFIASKFRTLAAELAQRDDERKEVQHG